MITEEREIPSGWPLGLGNMNMRLRVLERLPSFAGEPRSLHITSASFSSTSSSNLDTESTASFFQDHSVSLGRLIGFKRGERRGFYWTNSVRFEDSNRITTRDANSDISGHRVDMSEGICIPLLLGALVKDSYAAHSHTSIYTQRPSANLAATSKPFERNTKPSEPNPSLTQSHVFRSRQVGLPIHGGEKIHRIRACGRSQGKTRSLGFWHSKTKSSSAAHFQIACGDELCGVDAPLSHCHCFRIAQLHAFRVSPQLRLDP